MEQLIVFSVIILMLIFFTVGNVRYEFVSLSALLFLAIMGIISFESVFSGFSHPAVITVASVLVISSALIKSGVVEHVVVLLNNKSDSFYFKLFALMLVTGILSAFMNNVGALALILPIALKMAKDSEISPSKLLMPVAFASLMGGMLTIIGTPPNLIVSNYRVESGGEAFTFFEFLPVGFPLLIVGIVFVVLIGWRFIPKRATYAEDDIFNIGEYLSEVQVTQDSKMIGLQVMDFYKEFNVSVEVLSITREDDKIIVPHPTTILHKDDVLIIKTDSLQLSDVINRTKLTLIGDRLDYLKSIPNLKSEEFELIEVVLRDDSLLIGRTAYEIKLRNRFNVNLVAVSSQGAVSIDELKTFRFKSGDILLLQAPVGKLADIYQALSCLPLENRQVSLDIKDADIKTYLPISLFLIAIVFTTLGIIPVQIAFSIVALLLVFTKSITPREFYDAIEWPTILLLGTLLPLGQALQNSGASDTIAKGLLHLSTYLNPSMMLLLVMIITIVLTNLISSTATAVLMGPIAISVALGMGVNTDSFLIAVAIASTTAFMTPIAHQSNMLVMGPGGYQFKDYWKLGLPLSIVSLSISMPLILYLWPL